MALEPTDAPAPPDGLEVTPHEDYVEVEFTGDFSPGVAMNVVDVMVAACEEAHRSAILLDCRSMSASPSVIDQFTVAEYGAENIHRHITVAMLVREDLLLPDRFFENVAVSRGVRVRQFSDRTQAVDWLEKRA